MSRKSDWSETFEQLSFKLLGLHTIHSLHPTDILRWNFFYILHNIINYNGCLHEPKLKKCQDEFYIRKYSFQSSIICGLSEGKYDITNSIILKESLTGRMKVFMKWGIMALLTLHESQPPMSHQRALSRYQVFVREVNKLKKK